MTRPIDRSPRPDGTEPATPPLGSSLVDPQLFLDARAIADPGERALALIRISQTAIFSKQLADAHKALFEAAPAALEAREPLIRQQRMVAVIDSLLLLAEERMSVSGDEPTGNDELPPAPAAPTDSNRGSNNPGSGFDGRKPAAALPEDGRQKRLRAALPEWSLAADMALKLEEITARTEALFRLVESEAYSSQRLITDPLHSGGGGRPNPANLPADLRDYTDELLATSAKHANMIERPIWRNFATFSIVSNAAASSQFTRGFQIARSLEQPESRTNVLIRLAEGQATNGQPAEATAAYAEAARSVAMIPQNDTRETLVGVLVDSLTAFGRFEDARACIRLYTGAANQLVAYSAVAESQGRRGLAEVARTWITQEVDPQFRAILYRKVNDGLLSSIEQNRSQGLSRRSN